MIVRKVVELTLLVVVLAGGVWAGRLGIERAALEAEYVRLATKTGALEIGNPAFFHVRAIKTGKPLQFAWRVYIPAGSFNLAGHTGGSTFHGIGPAQENTVRLAFREDRGRLVVCFGSLNFRTFADFGDQSLADFLRGRWDQIVVDQFGQGEMAVADPKQPPTLLRLSIPPALIEEAKIKLSAHAKSFIPTLYTIKIQ